MMQKFEKCAWGLGNRGKCRQNMANKFHLKCGSQLTMVRKESMSSLSRRERHNQFEIDRKRALGCSSTMLLCRLIPSHV